MFGIGKRLDRLEERLEQIGKGQGAPEALERLRKEQEQLRGELARTGEAIGRHDRAIEDMLDAWEETREEQQEQISRMRAENGAERDRRAEEALRREERLLQTAIGLYDQLFTLRQTAEQTGNEIWQRQLELMLARETEEMALAGVQVTGRAGELFSYALHEAAQALETENAEQDRRIAEVLRPGFVYEGKVIRKAQTVVWKARRAD